MKPKALRDAVQQCGLLILASGFESRARALFDRVWSTQAEFYIVLIRYDFDIKENDDAYAHIKQTVARTGATDRLIEVLLNPRQPESFEPDLRSVLGEVPLKPDREIWLDISGLPMWAICGALRGVRFSLGLWDVRVFYTEAKTYFPTREEYTSSVVYRESSRLAIKLPDSLTSEMSEDLILEGFSGVALREHTTCLILFAGYEKHRSLGVIEDINPSLLLMVYGRPGRKGLEWRLEMSRKLHAALITERPTAEEVVSTLDVVANMRIMDKYYSMLYDTHNICISPVCSKLQAVAVYLTWERYRDIQMVFPLPVRYLPSRFSEGSGNTFSFRLPGPPGLLPRMV